MLIAFCIFRRKQIGVLAANKWKNSPKFNSPEAKAELDAFAEQIEQDCGIKEISFGKEGIKKHIKTFFNEQRRYKKRKSPTCDQVIKLLFYDQDTLTMSASCTFLTYIPGVNLLELPFILITQCTCN